MVTITIRNEKQVRAALKGIDKALNAERPALFQTLGRILQDDVRDRMDSRGGGSWAPPSKWILAKKNARVALAGQSRRVRFQTFPDKLVVFFDSPKDWTLTQHNDGFTVQPDGSRVTIPLQNPAALGLSGSAKTFSFISRKPSVVPARRSWPTEAEALSKINAPISMWVRKTVGSVPGVRV
jgi:hypothetical protein